MGENIRTFEINIEYYFLKDLERIVFIALDAVETMRFFYDNFQILFQTAGIDLLLSNIVPRVYLYVSYIEKVLRWLKKSSSQKSWV